MTENIGTPILRIPMFSVFPRATIAYQECVQLPQNGDERLCICSFPPFRFIFLYVDVAVLFAHALEALPEGVDPIGDLNAEVPLDFRLVEHTVCRSFHGRREFVGSAWHDSTVFFSCYVGNCHGEVVPRCDTLVAIMIYAGMLFVEPVF